MTTLEFVKSQENEDSLILILDDLPAKKVMQAWTLYAAPESRAPYLARPLTKKDKFVGQLLIEMWEKCPVDFEQLTKAAMNVPYQVVVETFARLKEARLVYPDCTIPAFARRFIRSEINAYRINLVRRARIPSPAAATTTPTTTTPAQS